jgi:hypothetical protein
MLAAGMRIDQIQTALKEGVPFEIATAAGDKFRVNDAAHLWIAPERGAVVLMTDDELVHIIPFLTMTSLTYLKPRQR